MGMIVEIHHVHIDNCRWKEEENNGDVAKRANSPDQTGKKARNVKSIKVYDKNVDLIDVFNPRKEVILSQIETAGGIEFYKGQILWISGM